MRIMATVAKPKILFKNGEKMRPNHADPSLELKHLVQNRGATFDLAFSEALISEIAQQLDLMSLRKAKFTGTVLPIGNGDWGLSGRCAQRIGQAPAETGVDTARSASTPWPERS